MKVLKEPLFHFLLCGFLLFLYFDWYNLDSYSGGANTIEVNKENLLTLMQYRSKAFQGDYFSDKFDALTEPERQQLVDDFIMEEVLYREAKKLKLAEDDYIIKKRMIQKVDFLYENKVDNNIALSPDSLLQYYEDHKIAYQQPSVFTFTHTFFKVEEENSVEQERKASSLLRKIQKTKIDFDEVKRYGDRFLYHNNYVEKDQDYIASHFGNLFADSVISLEADTKNWKGPFLSDHGYHIVLLTNKNVNGQQSYQEVKSEVEADYRKTLAKKMKTNLIQELIGNYEVRIDLD